MSVPRLLFQEAIATPLGKARNDAYAGFVVFTGSTALAGKNAVKKPG